MPEYEVNLSDATGNIRKQVRLMAIDAHTALTDARNTVGADFGNLVSVNQVTLVPVLLPAGPAPGTLAASEPGDAPGIPGGETVRETATSERLVGAFGQPLAMPLVEWVE